MNPYELLANAVIIQAAEDYRVALITLKNNPGSCYARRIIKDVEEFFLSAWFRVLTDLNGKTLMEGIKYDVRHE